VITMQYPLPFHLITSSAKLEQ
ncbi:hypothetical protein FOXB_17458, partial [Fusarium oxysporum f. sp. conglutinans Fo5176]